MSLGHSPSIATSGLILCLDAGNTRSYPGSGTTWTDISRNGYNGTLINSPSYSSLNGGVLSFNGSNTNVNLGNASIFMPTGAITVSMWVNSTVVNSYKKMFVTVSSGSQTIDGIYMSFGPNPYYSYTGIGTASGGNVTAGYGSPLSANTWYNICGTYNGAIISHYVNGILSGTASQSGAIKNAGIGRISGYDNNNETWSGYINNFCMWNRQLSAAEVVQNYNAIRGRYGL